MTLSSSKLKYMLFLKIYFGIFFKGIDFNVLKVYQNKPLAFNSVYFDLEKIHIEIVLFLLAYYAGII